MHTTSSFSRQAFTRALRLLPLLLLVFLAAACEREGIDDITPLDPGPDQGAPEVTIVAPLDGNSVQVLEDITSVDISFRATDDIEVASVRVLFDGEEIAMLTDFPDYRRVIDAFTYDRVTDGDHTITVVATDLAGNETTQSVTFTKRPAYQPVYAGETVYMPFNGDYIDLVNIRGATVVGNPGFAGQSVAGSNAYKGAEGAHLEYPTANLNLGNEFSAVFWMKVNADPDRAGILVIGPPDPMPGPNGQNNRNGGFRLFRENAAGMQRFKLNVGTGGAQSWFDGGAAADVDPTLDEWHHFAITLTADMAAVYIDGEVVSQGMLPNPVDWTGADVLSIMSGAPRFAGWNHLSDQGFMDELRFFNRGLNQDEIQEIILAEGGDIGGGGGGTGYTPLFAGEQFYLGFNSEGEDVLDMVSGAMATKVGAPTLVEGRGDEGRAYQGAEGAYLTFPAGGLTTAEFSASMWIKLNPDPARAALLVVGPQDTENEGFPETQNNRMSGFRFFREAAGDNQRFKLNIGTGEGESWFDGGEMADIPADSDAWHHLAFSIGAASATVYVDGQVASTGEFPGISWENCDLLSVMSGAPRFTGWNHLSDHSQLDDLRLFNKAITQEEVTALMND